MKVDVPFNMPRLREAVFGPEDAQPPAPVPSTGALTVSQILKVRGNCLQILQTPPLALNLGDQLKVLITTVISDRFFWGQIEDMHSMEQLQRISERLNVPREHREMATGPGRCAALFQGDGNWYRAWAIQGGAEHSNVRVFYLDYGNTDVIPWDHTAKNSERQVWDLQPMAVPFTLAEPVTNLNSRELTQLMVEVNAIGGLEEGNMVVVRATSLIPDLKDSMSCVGRTVIM
ncbi:hypothetical protein V1264_001980 [Littorina saxatilis]|uniref:Tudor domain-containing protein n=2 Tax=Littorina saxatilis TaxID=31220 RepID=A0AAN9GPH8_9CAEN